MKRSVLKAIAAAAVLATLGVAQAQEIREHTIKFATQNPKGHPMVLGMERFAENVSKKSGGKIKVNLFPGGVLGGDQANVSAVQGGTLEMVVLNTGILASVAKELAIFDFPFLISSSQEADALVDGPVGKKLHAKLEERGIVGLSYWELGFRNITNSKRPILKVDDIEGLKLRVIPNPINVDWVKALGANPTPLPFPELYAALEQKAIDGQENPLTVINANKLYEVQKYVTLTNHQYNPQSVIISKKFWDTLNAAEKKLIDEASDDATKYQREQSRAQAAAAVDGLKKGGMTVSEFSPAELAKLRDKMKPVVAKYSANVGEATVAEVQAELAKIRK
ncbi:MAG: ABC transporter substrate-binding protein [Curvibacter sp. RIFCSPHIGHO2_12_FULL_63_18]|uniref:TRAP transporter substrate-binding protein n=1 Tax=Rhodoferax sp. TaxID=50421 RepID=UPI0008B87D6A|nr:TRAP transporter substrate-binding protein [Rhodoferax sp.]OGO99574.1 MAG: ABC transporter substrate-binding protein [Curvibacter sp. GWA2_63_95]OGP03593.1 MAG: ABC transporter substrate-binding protein [Curvibacter sp. RIFCSPHIGHO2_12_FULL_63_18]HCX80887.1 ABC transporter substrate-binding protein [Rhodoferax sp.]